MVDYFSKLYNGDPFQVYSLSHLIVLGIMFLLSLMMYKFSHSIKETYLRYVLRYGLAIILIMTELTLHIWYFYLGTWDPTYSLPFQLCSVSLFLCIVMLFTKNYFLYEITYFTALGGAGQAMLTPELFYPFPHYRFFHFFIAHIVIILSPLYMTWIESYRPTIKSVWKTFAFINIYALFIFGINSILGSNYLWLREKPQAQTIIDFLGPYPWYIISLEFIALSIFLVLYLPFWIKDIKKAK